MSVHIRSSNDFSLKNDEFSEDLMAFECTDGQKQEHDENLLNVLLWAREKDMKFNLHKCIIGAIEAQYFGNLLSSDGMKLTTTKLQQLYV
jgi:hypothetical protein